VGFEQHAIGGPVWVTEVDGKGRLAITELNEEMGNTAGEHKN